MFPTGSVILDIGTVLATVSTINNGGEKAKTPGDSLRFLLYFRLHLTILAFLIAFLLLTGFITTIFTFNKITVFCSVH